MTKFKAENTFISKYRFSTMDIAAAAAKAILDDYAINKSPLSCIPMVGVVIEQETIVLSLTDGTNTVSDSFSKATGGLANQVSLAFSNDLVFGAFVLSLLTDLEAKKA